MIKLAIDGGPPVRAKLLPYGHQWIDDDDIEAVARVLRSDWLTTGPNVEVFEQSFAARVGAEHAVAVSSGTAALHAAVAVAGIGPGDEVIVPALTFVASANCVRYVGGTVVFADVRPDTLSLDAARLAGLLTPKTRAVVTVDFTGQPSDLDEISAFARQHGLIVIEDACHALGATYRQRPVGSLADLTVFSLHPVKHVTTGEGGMITTQRADWAAGLRRFRNHGITSDHRQREATGSWYYEMTGLGYNYRLTDFQCALGQSQLRRLDGWLRRRRKIAARYTEALAKLPTIAPPTELPDRDSAWHLYVIGLRLDRLRAGRAEIFKALRAEGIGVNVHYIPVPWHPYYQRLGGGKGHWPAAEGGYERSLSLPLFPAMTDQDVDDVVTAVSKVLGAYQQ